jgi:hypothetical protein
VLTEHSPVSVIVVVVVVVVVVVIVSVVVVVVVVVVSLDVVVVSLDVVVVSLDVVVVSLDVVIVVSLHVVEPLVVLEGESPATPPGPPLLAPAAPTVPFPDLSESS